MIKMRSAIGDAASAMKAAQDEDRARLKRRPAAAPAVEDAEPTKKAKADPPPHRADKEAMTVFYPKGLRAEIKIAAAREGRDITDVLAEAMNLWFASRGLPEIMPTKEKRR